MNTLATNLVGRQILHDDGWRGEIVAVIVYNGSRIMLYVECEQTHRIEQCEYGEVTL